LLDQPLTLGWRQNPAAVERIEQHFLAVRAGLGDEMARQADADDIQTRLSGAAVGARLRQRCRWIVEQTFGWLGRYRRLSKDYERNTRGSEEWIDIAMIHRMARFDLPDKSKDDDLLNRPLKRLNS
jgi:Transposase DDE domain